MKRPIKHAFLCIMICAIALSSSPAVSAAGTVSEEHTATAYLHEQGIMVGDATGDMMLDQSLTRAQLAIILTRIVANPEHIVSESTYYRNQCVFGDVPDWAKVYVGYCAANHLVAGYGNGFYGADDPVTPAAACTVMLRCLGDVGVDWGYSTARQTAIELSLAPAEALSGQVITRGNMAILICRTMEYMGYEVNLNNAETLASDLSQKERYVPKRGDVIVCDDGYRYTITDVSRWDNNAFASGPLEELPDYDLDWYLLPQPQFPKAEMRHFVSGGKDYLYIRNLYETRRMLYTLYEAVVRNPETWKNGKPVTFPSGNPKVKIQLAIPEGTEPQFFWPWRENQITELFDSCPPGTYYMEAWDVYCNGIFQYTEYNIHVV